MTAEELLREARTMIRDLMYDWPVKELHRTPESLVGAITDLLDDGYDPATATTTEERGGFAPDDDWDPT